MGPEYKSTLSAEKTAMNIIAGRESMMPVFIEHARTVAAVRRAQFDAYIEVGFTPEQAIFLIANAGVENGDKKAN